MCGFIGYIVKKQSKSIEKYNLKFDYYFNLLNNRGPDFNSKKSLEYSDFQLKFGFSRLAIQDISENANKIFYSEDFILLYNGEIYNKENLKKEYLVNQKLETSTDTEILFNLLKIYGNKILIH